MDAGFIRDLFREFGEVQIRRMFGGAGLWADEVMFALISREVIYLKADEDSIPAFEAEGCAAFSYDTKVGRHVLTSYWRMPERLYDDPDELAVWARQALTVAARKRAAKSPKGAGRTVKKAVPHAARRSAGKARKRPVKARKTRL